MSQVVPAFATEQPATSTSSLRVNKLTPQSHLILNSSFLKKNLEHLPLDNKAAIDEAFRLTGADDATLAFNGLGNSLTIAGVPIHVNFDGAPAKSLLETWQRVGYDVCALNNLRHLKPFH